MPRRASRESRTRTSSSTTSTVASSVMSPGRPRDGQAQGEARAAAGWAVRAELPAVLLHDLVADGEAEPGALAHRLGGEERVEDIADDVGGDPGSRVPHRQHGE